MLKKFISIRNVGRFFSSGAPGNPELAKHVTLLGANGYGKTTLCAVMRSVKTGDAAHVAGRKSLGVTGDISIELLFDNGAARFKDAQWSTTQPDVAIFDGVFVAENVHAGEGVDIDQKRNLYRVIVGDDGVKLAEEDARLAGSSRTMTGEITASTRTLAPYCPKGMGVDEFIALDAVADIDQQIVEQQRTVEAVKQSAAIKARAALSEFKSPTLRAGFAELLSRTIDDIAEDSQRLLSEHLSAKSMGEDGVEWIAKGLKHADDTCPFCAQKVEGLPLIAAFRAVFSDRYKALETDIEAMKDQIIDQFGDGALGKLETTAEQNKGGAEFWSKYCTFDAEALPLPANVVPAATALRDVALSQLRAKAATLLRAIAVGDAFALACTNYQEASQATVAANGNIRTVNELIAAKKAATEGANVQTAENELVRLVAVKTRHSDAIAPLCASHLELVADKHEVDSRKEQVRAQLNAHTRDVIKPYERRINEYLDAFNAGFSISETTHGFPGGSPTSSYRLVINQTAVGVGDAKTPISEPSFKNTLSAGDRTTLALAFFLAGLDRDPNLTNKIVVFDDPFNSQDAFRRRQTVHEIMKVAGRSAQVIVLSHDATFLKQVWDKAPAAERASLAIVDHRALGSKIMGVDLERATQGRTATDIDDLQTYLTSGAGKPVDIIRKMRVVLETYCRTAYPVSFQVNDWLGDIVRKIREGGDGHPAKALYDELDQINGYTSQYHHGEDVADATPDQIDPHELTGYARRTLKIVNALQA